MNDRAAVKSPENPGFKPKTRPVQTCGVANFRACRRAAADPVENRCVSTRRTEN
jgi:hypothetical protein